MKTAIIIGVGPFEGVGGYLCDYAAKQGSSHSRLQFEGFIDLRISVSGDVHLGWSMLACTRHIQGRNSSTSPLSHNIERNIP